MTATRVGRIGLPPVQVGLTNELVYLLDKYGVKKYGVEAWVWKIQVEMFFNHKFPFLLGEKQLSNSYCQEQNILQKANLAKSSLHFSWLAVQHREKSEI